MCLRRPTPVEKNRGLGGKFSGPKGVLSLDSHEKGRILYLKMKAGNLEVFLEDDRRKVTYTR